MLDAAIKLADKSGIESVSMRGLGQALGVARIIVLETEEPNEAAFAIPEVQKVVAEKHDDPGWL